jgi:broad specificity phosphatase PhoE
MARNREMVRGLSVVAKTLLLLFAFVLIAAGRSAAQTTTVIVVRHAEKVDDSADPLLSEAGSARARALAEALQDAGVTAIYTTQLQRTRLTAEPLARAMAIAPVVIGTGSPVQTHVDRIADRIRESDVGGIVVVVGHSNTVPLIVSALGGPDINSIEDEEYDHMFVLTLRPDASPLLVRAQYGR